MAAQLKGTVINMKSLSQHISNPIVVGGGESHSRFITILFTQEAAAQFSDHTTVYLSWKHIEKNVKGYNAFTEIPREDTDELTAEEQPPAWYIYLPENMLHEGHVQARIELVDEISLAASTDFTINVLADPWEETDWIENDDLSEFKNAVIKVQQMTSAIDADREKFTKAINYLFNMFNVTDFEDWDGDGEDDSPEVPDDLLEIEDDGITIVEWTGEE